MSDFEVERLGLIMELEAGNARGRRLEAGGCDEYQRLATRIESSRILAHSLRAMQLAND